MRRLVTALVVLLAGCYDAHPTFDGGGSRVDAALPISCSPGDACDCRATLRVPAGMHIVGTAEFAPDGPPHTVVLTRDSWLGRYEATAACYARCLEEGGCAEPLVRPPLGPEHYNTPAGYYRDPLSALLPIVALDREMARTYCEWLGGRLPTNAEWEKAARGETGRYYPWTDEGPGSLYEACLSAHLPGTSGDDSCPGEVGYVVRVDSFPNGAGPYGHVNMFGNAAEWVADSYLPYSVATVSDPIDLDPSAPQVLRFAGPEREPMSEEDFARGPRRPRDQWSVRCAFDAEPAPLVLSATP
jgi:formylglycine-generating enzyme required for sulfatase activity